MNDQIMSAEEMTRILEEQIRRLNAWNAENCKPDNTDTAILDTVVRFTALTEELVRTIFDIKVRS